MTGPPPELPEPPEPPDQSIEELDARLAHSRERAAAQDGLRQRLRRTTEALGAAQDDEILASRAAAWARREADRARLPHLRGWLALLTGRYREQVQAADAATRAAEQAAAAATAAVRRLQTTRADHRDAYRLAARAAADLPGLVAARRMADLRRAGDPRYPRLRALAARERTLVGRRRELDEAQAAVTMAQQSLRTAAERLGSARSWGTYDTWLGGGIIASVIKHDRIDEANDALDQVRAWVSRARAELADVQLDLADASLRRASHRGMDIWFDNLFTDLAVQGQIRDQLAAVSRLVPTLDEVAGRLERECARSDRELGEVRAERVTLLGPG